MSGLFYFFKGESTSKTNSDLKPSQIDFTQSNLPQNNQKQELEQNLERQPTTHNENTAQEQKAKQQIDISSLSEADQKRYHLVEEVLISKNDNDSRIDAQLKKMSPELHRVLAQKYEQLNLEDRNGRGLITFLVTRDFNPETDAEFLKSVLAEKPCLSLANCSTLSADNDPHFSGVNQTTLAYPQLAILYSLENDLKANPQKLKNESYKNSVQNILSTAESFEVPAVQKKAQNIREQFKL